MYLNCTVLKYLKQPKCVLHYLKLFYLGTPGCGGIYTSPSGIISSPVDLVSDSSNYLNNLNCEWHIRMPLHQKIKLGFVKKFGIELSTNCTTDFLEVSLLLYEFY